MIMNGRILDLTNIFVVQLFHHQLYVVAASLIVAIGLLLVLGALLSRSIQGFNLSGEGVFEPRARTVLRWGFGVFWLVDGILQFQPSMPLGLATSVVAGATSGTPSWLHSIMNSAIGLWNDHPLHFAVATAWIQVGIGITLLVANGAIGRWMGGIAAGWAALIWVVGNGAGGLFLPGNSLLFGWPGAPLFYAVAGVWLAVSYERFERQFSQFTVRFVAVVLASGALRQLLPSLGFWHGGNENALTAMTQDMTGVAQPHWVATIVRFGGTVAGTMGGGFNLLIVLWLLVAAAGLWVLPTKLWSWPIWSVVVFGVVFWFVGEDVALWGGLATDINSMLPLAMLTVAALPSLRSAPPFTRRLPAELRSLTGGTIVAFAVAMVIYSVGLFGWSLFSSVETTFYIAGNGQASAVNNSAPSFSLRDQSGIRYSLNVKTSTYVVLTFLDPVCNTDCPLLGAQLKAVRDAFPASAPLDVVAIAANPLHETPAEVQGFIKRYGLSSMKNFHFVTGPTRDLKKIWASWGISVQSQKGQAMSVHSDYVFVLQPHARLRWIIPDNPLDGRNVTQRSDAAEIEALLRQVGA